MSVVLMVLASDVVTMPSGAVETNADVMAAIMDVETGTGVEVVEGDDDEVDMAGSGVLVVMVWVVVAT